MCNRGQGFFVDKTTGKPGENAPEEAYFDGFKVAVGSGNVAVKLLRDERPFITLHASCATAEMLSKVLVNALNVEEKKDASSKNPPAGYFRSAYEDPDLERIALEEAMGQVEQTVER